MLRADLDRRILEKSEVGLRIMQLLSERLRRQETRLEDVGMKDVRARLASIIVVLVESEGKRSSSGYRIPTHYTHERLGTTIWANRTAVTRAFGSLQDEDVVQLRRASDLRYRPRRSKEVGWLRRCPGGIARTIGTEPYCLPRDVRVLASPVLLKRARAPPRPSSTRSRAGPPGPPSASRASPDHS